jgi:ribosomal protein S18 acetylase RimI-like enzyme
LSFRPKGEIGLTEIFKNPYNQRQAVFLAANLFAASRYQFTDGGNIRMEIRKVTPNDDFDALGEIYAKSWKTAYQGIVPHEYLEGLDGSRWAGVLAASQNDAYVIMDGGKYVGTSSICAARDERLKGWGEIISIYLLPEYFGKGYAKPLFERAVNALAEKGYKNIYLWVLAENKRAQRFYEKNGFHKSRDIKHISIGGKELTEFRYSRHL